MFVDEAKVTLRAGNGGKGSAGFRREKFIPFGGPDGGDGGKGGDVYALGDENLSDLEKYSYTPNLSAGDGGDGMGRQKTGASGADAYLRVPPGTVIINDENGAVVAEILRHNEKILLLRGGKGGLGNIHFKSSTNRAPRQFTYGTEGESGEFRLVLKSIADAGLVGYPNAGKSSLVSLITNANPKIGAYPFTTLHVNIGTLEYPDHYDKLKLADIPGLIDGASDFTVLRRIYLPLAKPILAVVSIYSIVTMWNNWFAAQVYLPDKNLHPLQLYLKRVLVAQTVDLTKLNSADIENAMNQMLSATQMQYAMIIFTTLPIIFTYPFFQKYFIKGVMLGSLKG